METGVSNEEVLEEVKRLRVDMKEMYWQMLLKFNEQLMALQNQMNLLNQNMVLLNNSKPTVLNSEDVFFEKKVCQRLQQASSEWAEVNVDEIDNVDVMPKSSESDDGMYGDEEEEQTQVPVVLEVTTSNTGALNEMMNNDSVNSAEEKNIKEDLEKGIDTVSPYTCLSRHMYEESSHIANCKDRHCMLCKSLCVTDQNNYKPTQKSPWKCAICQKYFRRKYNLKNHMRCHTGEKPYQCKTCKRFYRSKQALNYHSHKHNNNYQQKLQSNKTELQSEQPEYAA